MPRSPQPRAWQRMLSGRRLDLLDPTPVDIEIEDIAHGLAFVARGVRILASDLGYAGKLFWRAAIGESLLPREVTSLRRTARDMVSFVPFVIILAIPITPLGHVLVFSWIQSSFPGFFPSQFTETRQNVFMRYEELRQELYEAQEENDMQFQNSKLQEAVAAVEGLRKNEPGDESGDSVVRAALTAFTGLLEAAEDEEVRPL